jgi:hypothetical protein
MKPQKIPAKEMRIKKRIFKHRIRFLYFILELKLIVVMNDKWTNLGEVTKNRMAEILLLNVRKGII